MTVAPVKKLTANSFSDLLYFCYDHSEVSACIACVSAESAETLVDELMRDFGKTEIPLFSGVGWDSLYKCGEVTFFNGSKIHVIPASDQERLSSLMFHIVLCEDGVDREFERWAINHVYRYDVRIADAFDTKSKAKKSITKTPKDENIIDGVKALDDFLSSFEIVSQTTSD